MPPEMKEAPIVPAGRMQEMRACSLRLAILHAQEALERIERGEDVQGYLKVAIAHAIECDDMIDEVDE